MVNLKKVGRVFYGLGIAGIGILHFVFPGFRPIIIPVPPEATQNFYILIYIFALYLVASGLWIALGKYVKSISILLGYVLLLFLLLGHLPNRIKHHPEINGYWIDAFKLLALTGGAFVISLAFPDTFTSKFLEKAAKIARLGKYFFAIMLIDFGIGHLLNPRSVGGLVPKWIPFHVFWACFTGIALVGSGISIFINFRVKLIGLLLAIMLFSWLVLIHIPFAIRFPTWRSGENIVGSFECLAFCGIALIMALSPMNFKVPPTQLTNR